MHSEGCHRARFGQPRKPFATSICPQQLPPGYGNLSHLSETDSWGFNPSIIPAPQALVQAQGFPGARFLPRNRSKSTFAHFAAQRAHQAEDVRFALGGVGGQEVHFTFNLFDAHAATSRLFRAQLDSDLRVRDVQLLYSPRNGALLWHNGGWHEQVHVLPPTYRKSVPSDTDSDILGSKATHRVHDLLHLLPSQFDMSVAARMHNSIHPLQLRSVKAHHASAAIDPSCLQSAMP